MEWVVCHWFITGDGALQFELDQFGIYNNWWFAWSHKLPSEVERGKRCCAYCYYRRTESGLARSCHSRWCLSPQFAFQIPVATVGSSTVSPGSFGTTSAILINSNQLIVRYFDLWWRKMSKALRTCLTGSGCRCSVETMSSNSQFDSANLYLGCPDNSKYLNLRPCYFDKFVLSWTNRCNHFKQTNFQK